MKKTKIVESEGNTYYIKGRGISKGCQQCLKGAKAVLFLNGICQKPQHCYWYCPISEERRGKDITFIDEIQISSKDQIIEEIRKINAKGASITGGEPLFKPNLEKTLEYIKYMKDVKGKKFHVHLYTNSLNMNKKIAEKLVIAGLDELRFHPPLNDKNKWENIKFALNKNMSIGAEVPIIPSSDYIKNLKDFIFYLDKIGAEFINLNEFECCIPNSQFLKERGFQLKEGTIASVINSQEKAFNLIEDIASKVSIKIHFCSIISKDYHQLKNRYLRRAKSIKLPYEEYTEEGLLLYAQIEGRKENLTKFYDSMSLELKIPQKLFFIEGENIKSSYRLALEDQFISMLEKNNLKGFIVESTPFRREKYRQITEKTPITIFKEEIGIDGD